jgi:hypothetical protein
VGVRSDFRTTRAAGAASRRAEHAGQSTCRDTGGMEEVSGQGPMKDGVRACREDCEAGGLARRLGDGYSACVMAALAHAIRSRRQRGRGAVGRRGMMRVLLCRDPCFWAF